MTDFDAERIAKICSAMIDIAKKYKSPPSEMAVVTNMLTKMVVEFVADGDLERAREMLDYGKSRILDDLSEEGWS
jgi:uncharacterized protein YejL (UPF0352 family)